MREAAAVTGPARPVAVGRLAIPFTSELPVVFVNFARMRCRYGYGAIAGGAEGPPLPKQPRRPTPRNFSNFRCP